MCPEMNDHLNQLAHRYIPGGAHTYSRGDDQFPANAPKILKSGQGAYVWDADGRKFLDYGMALRSVTLGYSNEQVNKAAFEEIMKGNNLTRASETEILAAEKFCQTIPACDMVKFAKNGSTVVSAATKLARSFTGRTKIARCADHPFFSFDDWFIGNTQVDRGVPDEIKKLTLQFRFNDIQSLRKLFDENPGEIACVVCEPAATDEPQGRFLQDVIDLAHKNGAVVIFDEMITGFRWDIQGACKYYGVTPDLITFGKGMANGFSVAALGGRREIMELGGLFHKGERVFLISTTHGAEMCGLGAFMESLKIYQECPVTEHFWKLGKLLTEGLNAVARDVGIENQFVVAGPACSPYYLCKDREGKISFGHRTLFAQELIKKGILMPWIALSYAHTVRDIELTIEAAREALQVYSKALNEGLEKYLDGPSIKPVFRKLN